MAIASPQAMPRSWLSDIDLRPRLPAPDSRSTSALPQKDLVPARRLESERAHLDLRRAQALVWVRNAIAPLTALPPDWDSYGGRPVDSDAAEAAESLVVPLLTQGVESPAFVPAIEGGISVEWYRPTVQLVIRFPGVESGLTASAFFADDASQEEWEYPLSAAIPKLGEALTRFILPEQIG